MRVFLNLLLALLCTASVARAASSPELLKQGEYVAHAGDCVVCHTGPGEKPFAGGLKMATPVGNIATTNITPDPETGIGNYTFEEFDRSMRHGIAKDGHRLFPAMPYPSYANMSDADMKALYAFFHESIAPVKRPNTPKELPWPVNVEWALNAGLAVWDAVFVDAKPFQAKPDHDTAWNRGAYLVEGLGHCGSCHTPRGIFFQEKALTGDKSAFVSGAELDHWSAPNLRADLGDGLGSWSEAEIAQFLKTGHAPTSMAFGTMIDVINNSTQYLTDDDLNAIAHYLKALPAGARSGEAHKYDPATVAHLSDASPKTAAEQTYIRRCAGCHALDGKGHSDSVPPLAGNPAVLDVNASSVVNVVLNGSQRIVVDGEPDAYRMIQFREILTDDEVADVVTFVRSAWGNTAWPVKADQVGVIRVSTDPATDAVTILRMR